MQKQIERFVAQKGIAGIVAVVILIAIVVIASLAVYFWATGVVTKQPTLNEPVPIAAILLNNNAGHMEVMIANLGDTDIVAGTDFTVAENGARATLPHDLAPGEQIKIRFWGGTSCEGEVLNFKDKATIYTTETGATAPPVYLVNVVEEANLTYNASGGDTGYDPSVISTRLEDGLYWMCFSSDAEPSGSHDIFLRNSTDGLNWGEVITAADQGFFVQEDTPFMIIDDEGVFWVIFRSFYSTDSLRMVNSSDGNTWSSPFATTITFTGGGEFDYTINNLRGFAFLKDENDVFWISYQYNNELRVQNSTDAINWNPVIVVDDTVSPGRTSLIKTPSKYWVAAVGTDPTTIEVFNSPDANNWTKQSTISDTEFGNACTGPSLLYTQNTFFLFTDMKNSTDECEKIQVLASEDGVYWSNPSFLPSYSGVDIAPYAMYDSEVYWLAFGNTALQTIYTRYSTDPMIWLNI